MLRPTARAALVACALTAAAAPAAPAADPAARAAAARSTTWSVAAPADGAVLAAVGAVRGRGVAVRVASAPRGVAVVGGTAKGRLAVLVLRPAGAAAGRVTLRLTAKGAAPRVRGMRTGPSPAGACAARALFARPLRTSGALARGPLAAAGRALADRLCGRPHDAALLARLGLGGALPRPVGGVAVPAPVGVPGRSPAAPGPPAPVPPATAGPPLSPGPPPAGVDQCRNGADDDGDGQVDHRDLRQRRPDPGCTGPDDRSEGSEVAVGDECARGMYASRGQGAAEVVVAINAGCGAWTEAWINTAPAATGCSYVGADVQGVTCAQAGGGVVLRGATATMADAILGLGSGADCAVPATFALTRADGTVAELVEPIGSCAAGGGAPATACANGLDDDGDGQTDAWAGAGRPDADPGCDGDDDTSEDGEVATPAGCDIVVGVPTDRPANEVHAIARGCTPLTAISLRPPGTAVSCDWHLPWASRSCQVGGGLAWKSLSPHSDSDAHLSVTLTEAAPVCGRPLTVVLQRPDGQPPIEGRLPSWEC